MHGFHILDPADRKYKNSHEWVKVDGDIATVGITDHAQSALGEIVFADLPEIGSTVEAAQSTAAVESVKAVSDVYSPIAGEIVQVNDKLEDTPNLINEKPHDDGWMFQVKLTNPGDYDALMDSDSYTKSLEESK